MSQHNEPKAEDTINAAYRVGDILKDCPFPRRTYSVITPGMDTSYIGISRTKTTQHGHLARKIEIYFLPSKTVANNKSILVFHIRTQQTPWGLRRRQRARRIDITGYLIPLEGHHYGRSARRSRMTALPQELGSDIDQAKQSVTMFSTMHTPVSTNKQLRHYTPHVPSPLSSSPLQSSPPMSPLEPRNANLPTRAQAIGNYQTGFLMSPEPSVSSKPSSPDMNSLSANRQSPNREGAFSKRITKTNPLLHGQGDGRETRRKLFLRKVREDSEEKRWKARGGDDEMMRTIWIAEQRRRAERQARDAQGWAVDAEANDEQDMELDYGAGNLSLDEAMAEEVARNEEEELEALLSSMTEVGRRQTLDEAYENVSTLEEIGSIDERESAAWSRGDFHHSPSQPDKAVMDIQRKVNESSPDTYFGSDDGDYDAIFMDVIQQESRVLNQEYQCMDIQGDHDMMDTEMS
ncbi:hypothetical protein NHQ30_008531 [Ciborinia camelliae]|nr:hypothetical protein NHQ30_008531 [Ciborinia camelliae]